MYEDIINTYIQSLKDNDLDKFITDRFADMLDSEKISRPSFENMESGKEISDEENDE